MCEVAKDNKKRLEKLERETLSRWTEKYELCGTRRGQLVSRESFAWLSL